MLRANPPGAAALTVEIAAADAHGFFLGETSEVVLILADRLTGIGSVAAAGSFLRALPMLSRRYCRAIGRASESPRRFPVLRGFELDRNLGHSTLTRDTGVFVAAMILAGLHPACRLIESQRVMDAYARQEFGQDRLVALLGELAALSGGHLHKDLDGSTAGMQAAAWH